LTAEPLDSATLPATDVKEPKRKPVERPRFPLVLKLFLLTALLIVIVVAVAIGITVERANRIAHTTVNNSIASAARLFKEFERQRLDRLALGAQLLGNDPNFAAYIQAASNTATPPATATATAPAAPAPPTVDLVSILDQLTQRKESFGSDVLILLDDQGRVVARTDQPMVTTNRGEDLYEATPLVKKIVEETNLEKTTGVILLGEKLYHAAVVPIAVGANHVRMGFLINAYAIDDAFANRLAESTNAGVLFAPAGKMSAAPAARSANAPSVGMQQMSGIEQIFKSGKMIPPSEIKVDRSSYVMTGEPLMAGSKTVGAAVFVRSLDVELAPFRQIENTLFVGGGAALLLALIFSWLIAKRVTRPIESLAGFAQAVAGGDYTVRPVIDRDDEVGILSRSFAMMVTALRDKAEIEELYEQMAARSEEREVPRSLQVPMLDEGTVLVTDLRGLPATVGEGDAANVIGIVARVMRLQEAEVKRQDGEVREVVGHRLVSIFRGERGIIHAIRAARAINEELAQEGRFGMTLGVGIATGDFVIGGVQLEQESGLAIVGNAPLLALHFAWHAPSGHAYISYETAQAAGTEVLNAATREEVRLKWLPQPLPVASLSLVAVSTGMMRSIGGQSTMATMRIESTVPGPTAPSHGASADLESGSLFASRYRIEQILGRGGMGVVYRAVDTQLDETVAIKTLPGDVMQRSSEDLERFKREIRLARKITHRNVLRTYDYGEAEGVYFISMEFVRGYTLSDLLVEADEHQMAPRVANGIARQVCRGLDVAHEQGIIHRDIKPQNVLIDHKGEVKLMDFGIARLAEAPEAMTQAGLIVGTPHYMSPEQVQGKALDPRSDVYAMGVLIYEMLVGRRPFESTSLTGVLTAHITEAPEPPIDRRPEIGREMNAIVMRCLEKDPKARYANAGELLRDLDQVQMQAHAA